MPDSTAHPTRVAVVGVGNVGATFAYALLLSGLASEIVLIDANRQRAEGEATDLTHAVPFSRPTRVWAGEYADCAGAAVTVITAGAAQRPGEDRLSLVKRNDGIFGQIVPAVAAPTPMGSSSSRRTRSTCWPTGRGSGRGCPRTGSSGRAPSWTRPGSGPCWPHTSTSTRGSSTPTSPASTATPRCRLAVGDDRRHAPADYCLANDIPYDEAALNQIFVDTRDAAYRIIEQKGATYYAVAAGLTRLTEAILRDQNTVLPVSTLVPDYHGIDDVYLSLPTIVGGEGIRRTLRLELTDDEAEGLRHSASVLRSTLDSLDPLGAAQG